MTARKILNALECNHIPPKITELSLVITSDREIQELNRFYRKKDKPTDVLSFSQLENLKHGLPSKSLGDIVISFETALLQSKKYGVTIDHEILRLLIHGILHLFGYDHEGVSKSVAERMRRTEKKLYKLFESGFSCT